MGSSPLYVHLIPPVTNAVTTTPATALLLTVVKSLGSQSHQHAVSYSSFKKSSPISYPVAPCSCTTSICPPFTTYCSKRNHYWHLIPFLSSPGPMPSWLLPHYPIKTLVNITTEVPVAKPPNPTISSPLFFDLTIWDMSSFLEEILSSLVSKTLL